MKEWKVDVPVLLIFFARSDTFEKVFEAVREARPSTLLLWQDGPRENRPDDIENINKCRRIAENIDWDCTVYKMYNEKNIGCDPSIFYAYNWAFTHVDRCIFLEDDQVPCQSYFRFCKELLDRYENDTRISHICGYNYTEIAPDCDADYLFATSGSGAWATWKRVADMWDGKYRFLDDKLATDNVKVQYGALADISLSCAERHRKTGKEFWESIVGCNCLYNNMLSIIPKKNLVSNMGLTHDSVHSNTNKKYLPKVTSNLFEMKTYELEFPMKHPDYVIENKAYRKKVNVIMGTGHPLRVKWRQLVHSFKKIFIK
ncbi:MAG: hypothetical protein IJE65_00130 [Clostridia bacterium]|nr:hypothetical protein [Clostridia bacterium]